MNLAPIIVFCYNRPWHVAQTLEALSKNVYAAESELYIFCDGPKPDATEEQINKVVETRSVVRKKQWCKEVYIVEAEKNKGLANSIINGVTQVINKHGRVIVLEDDLVTSHYFLKFMNEALEKYQDRQGVMSISANRPPIGKMKIPDDYPYDVFASLRSYSTGWGTWKDRWNRVDWSLDYLNDFLNHPNEVEAFNRGGDDMTKMLLLQRDGQIDSWAIRFGFAHFREHCVAILPRYSYVDNIGFDGSGIHSGVCLTNEYRNNLNNAIKEPRWLDNIYEDKDVINAFYNRFCAQKRPLYQKTINKISRLFHCSQPYIIKGRVYVK